MYLYILVGIVVGVLCASLFRRKGKSDNRVADNVPTDTSKTFETSEQEPINVQKDIVRITTTQADDQSKALSDRLEAQQKELKAMKRKVEDLEDELEDAEDDKKSAEEKLKSQRDEFNKLFDDMQHTQLERQRLQEENDRLHEVSKKQKRVIEFVSYILNAPAADRTERSSRQLNLVDQLAAFIKDDFAPLMRENNIPINFNRVDLERFVANQKKTWITGKTAVAFIGEFSSGKTSIVNRILKAGNPNATLLPTSSKATTAIPTYISSTSSNSFATYSFISKDESLKVMESRMVEEMSKETLDEVRGMDQLIHYVVREEANTFLCDISILDTPGFSSNDAKDKERTLEVVNECDALFWVIDVNNGSINQSSLAVIKKELKKPLYIIVNKVDTKAKSEVDKVVSKIEETLRNKGVPCQGIIRFSVKEELEMMMKVIRSIKPNHSEINYFENAQTEMGRLHKKTRDEYNAANEVSEQYADKLRQGKRIIQEIWGQIDDLCQNIRTKPSFKKGGILNSMRFEMTVDEYNEMVSFIDKIIDRENSDSVFYQLNKEIASLEQNALEYGKATKKISELSKRGIRIKESREQFNKLINDLSRWTTY